ncbi:MAG: alpha-L-rhamnosidase [Pseudonocardiales bacterium]|nr:alpha-L-rhamnosidase [Pseudonocardiales bacterium]
MAATPAHGAIAATRALTSPAGLQTNERTNPVGIDGGGATTSVGATLRFGWQVPTLPNERDLAQTAYQIQVSTSPTFATVLWDSGQVAVPNSVAVPYGGSALASSTRYFWHVKSKVSDGNWSGWSAETAFFETGLLTPADWSKSSFIGTFGYARTSFTQGAAPTWARLYVAARANNDMPSESSAMNYVATINGHQPGDAITDPVNRTLRVGDEFTGSPYSDTRVRVYYKTYDVTKLVQAGTNVLGFETAASGGIKALLVVRDSTGLQSVGAYTDSSWQTHAGPALAGRRNGETFNAQSAIAGWNLPSFQPDATWTHPTAFVPGTRNVLARTISPGLTVTSSSTPMTGNGWSPAALVDGTYQSTSTAAGYRSQNYDSAAPSPAPWVQIDLGSQRPFSGIALYPAWPTNLPHASNTLGYGFPVDYKVEVSNDATFRTAVTAIPSAGQRRTETTGVPQYGDPGDPATSNGHRQILYPDSAVPAQYVRITATTLRSLTDVPAYGLALAEASVWQQAPLAAEPELVATPFEPVRAVKARPALSVTPKLDSASGKTVYVADFGTTIAGTTVATLRGLSSATPVAVAYGQMLGPDGRVVVSYAQYDTFNPGSASTATWGSRFMYRGFRYAEFSGLSSLTTADVTAYETHNDLAQTGTFSSSNATYNAIAAMVRQTDLDNTVDQFTDNPTRERRQWLGDLSLVSRSALQQYAIAPIYTKSVADMLAEMQPNLDNPDGPAGQLFDLAPGERGSLPYDFSDPAWGIAAVQVPWNAFRATGDLVPLAAAYSLMTRYVDYLAAQTLEGYLVAHAAHDRGWGDWNATTGGYPDADRTMYQTAFVFEAAALTAKVAMLVGTVADHAKYDTLATNIASAFNAKFLLNSGTGQAHYAPLAGANTADLSALPLAFGMASTAYGAAASDAAAIAGYVQSLTHAGNGTQRDTFAGGIFAPRYITDALQGNGYSATIGTLLAQTGPDTLANMAANGPGGVWESWGYPDPYDAANVLDQPALGSAATWFYDGLLGLTQDPNVAGYSTSIIAPQLVPGTTWASGALQTPYGRLASSWQTSGTGLWLDVTIPANTVATVRIPTLGVPNPVITESGAAVWGSAGASSTLPAGIHSVAAGNATIDASLGSGTYHFEVGSPNSTVLDDTASAIGYTPGFHRFGSLPAGTWINSSAHSSPTAGDVATYSCTSCSRIRWIATTGSDRGTATVTVDGVAAGTVDQYGYGGVTGHQIQFDTGPLTPGRHTIAITVGRRDAFASSSWIEVDAFVTLS